MKDTASFASNSLMSPLTKNTCFEVSKCIIRKLIALLCKYSNNTNTNSIQSFQTLNQALLYIMTVQVESELQLGLVYDPQQKKKMCCVLYCIYPTLNLKVNEIRVKGSL